jgi:uncharacterized protein
VPHEAAGASGEPKRPVRLAPPRRGAGVKIAIIGSGVSGLVCAHLLHPAHEIVLYEAASHPGGHVRTVKVEEEEGSFAVDTGFIVYNERHYPLFTRLLERLGVAGRNSDMSFSVHDERDGFEFLGGPLRGLFARKRNLVDAGWWGAMADILRFHRLAPRMLAEAGPQTRLGDSVAAARLGRRFREQYLVPLASALWSAPAGAVEDYPTRFVLGFLANHGMLQLGGRPVWRTIAGGSRRYVDRLLEPLGRRLRLEAPVRSLRRLPDGVELVADRGPERFDHAILAVHSDQALRILTDPLPAEREILGAVGWQTNEVLLHHDAAVMPDRRAAWASWNYRIPLQPGGRASLSYDLNRLQGLRSRRPLLVSLNLAGTLDPRTIRHRHHTEHPAFGLGAFEAQQRHAEINGLRRTWYCGAWWGHGFHEDGVRSAVRVCEELAGVRL